MTTDQQLIDALKPLLDKAREIDTRTTSVHVILDAKNTLHAELPAVPWITFCGGSHLGRYSVESAFAALKPYDPEAIRLARLIALENEANELREQIRKDAEEKAAK